MLISRKRSHIHRSSPILLNGTPLDRVEVFKYLGIHISSDLSWSHHIQTLCSKTRRMLGLLYRRFYADADPFTLRQYYLSFIRPHLEYGCEVWDPHLVKDINALEGVQRFASRICSKQWRPQVEYPAMLESLHIPPLGSRRLKMKVCLLHRMIHGQSIYHDPPFDYRTATFASRSVNPLSLTRPFAKHNYYLYSYFPSTISFWNSLPYHIAALPLNSFKSALDNYV